MKKILFLLISVIFAFTSINAQVYSNKIIKKDSAINKEYNYLLPIWGKKVTDKGFDLPYSAGFGLNYFWQKSDLLIDNLQVGFNNQTPYPLDDIIRFNKAEATAMSINVRPDFWLFPFLNIYGIAGITSASTAVGFGIWIPDSTNTEREIMSMESKVDFRATTFGLGLTPTIGVAGGWIALDMNFTWTDVPQLEKPAFAWIFGPRIGKTFRFKNPNSNIAVWVGGMRVSLNSSTSGSINLADVMPVDEWNTQVDNGIRNVADAQEQVDAWWENLTQVQQNNPVNKAKYDAANATLAKVGELLNEAEQAIFTASNSTVQYSMDKRPKDKWNLIVGSQYQISKHFMIRVEGGFLGSRTQVIGGLQYRFGL